MAEDQRIRLTKTLLKNALIDLLQEKTMAQITIKEICIMAGVNRTTFYKYYIDEYNLLEEIENDLLKTLQLNIIHKGETLLDQVFIIIRENMKITKALVNNNIDPDFPNKLFAIPNIKKIIKEFSKEMYSENEFNKIYLFICNGGYALVKDWIINNCTESPKEIADFFFKIIINFFKNNSSKK